LDIGWFIGGLGFSILGLLTLLSLLAHLDFVTRSKKWPFVKGTIQTSRVQIEDRGTDDNGGSILLYRPEIFYRYKIEDSELIVREPAYDVIVDLQSAEKWVATYPAGKQVNVFYDPVKPRESTLKTSFKIPWSLYLVISLVLLALGVWCFFEAFKD